MPPIKGYLEVDGGIKMQKLPSIITPPVGYVNIAFKSDGLPYYKDSSGTEHSFSGGTGKTYATLTIGASNALGGSYDYACDGTADEAQINAAIAALPAGGGKIILSEGTFTLSTAVVINKSNVVIEGQGRATVLTIINAINDDVIRVGDDTNFSNITIRNLYISGNGTNQSTSGYGIYITNNVYRVLIERVDIYNTKKANFRIATTFAETGVSDIWIVNCTCDTSVSHSNIDNDGDYIYVLNSTFTNAAAGQICVDLRGNYCYISNCTVTQGTGGDGIYLGQYSTGIGNRVFVSNADTKGIYSNTGDNSIIGNNVSCTGTAVYGIQANVRDAVTGNIVTVTSTNNSVVGIYHVSTNAQICGNTVYFNSPSGTETSAILCDEFDTCNNNIIYINGARDTIGISQTAGENSCCGNSIYNANGSGTKTGIAVSGNNSITSGNFIYSCTIGIKFTSNVSYDVITSNAMESCATGISSSGSNLSKCTVSNNTIKGNGSGNEGINLSGSNSQHSIISNNTIALYGKDGITVTNFRNGSITGNKIADVGRTTNNTYSGIIVKGSGGNSTYNIISGNTVTSASSNKPAYGIREDTSSDGPNVVTGNICLNSISAQISTQHGSTVTDNNITA